MLDLVGVHGQLYCHVIALKSKSSSADAESVDQPRSCPQARTRAFDDFDRAQIVVVAGEQNPIKNV
jgi:hypothetical protein